MKQGIVKFSKEFVTATGLKEWASIDYPVEFDGLNDDKIAAEGFIKAEAMVMSHQAKKSYLMHYEITYTPSVAPSQEIPVYKEDRTIGVTVDVLYSCTDLATLDAYRLIVKGKDDLQSAYDKHRKILVAKESKKIIEAANKHKGGGLDKYLKDQKQQ